MSKSRSISRLIQPQMVIEGAGVRLLRSFGPSRSNLFDPFLLFDHFAFNDPAEGDGPGFPTHPHRGIETVTYMLEGVVSHRDSLGNQGLVGPGDVQWMTSGRGILHEEMPRRGPSGNIFGFQLWVNLPAAVKMSPPRYQEIKAAQLPLQHLDGASLRLVAGEVGGLRGPVTEIAINPVYMEVQLEPGASFAYPVNPGATVLAYVFAGEALFGDAPAQPVSSIAMLVLEDGEVVQVQAGEAGARFMLAAGTPIREPIAPYGPFVMNTTEEIQQALADLRNGTFVTSA